MEKLGRFVAKHYWGTWCICVFCGGFSIGMIPRDCAWSFPVKVLIWALTLLVAIWCATRRDYFLRKAINEMNTACDPYPLLQEAQLQQTYSGPAAGKQIMTINCAVALRGIGEYDRAYALLEMTNIDKYAMPLSMKLGYYNNRMDLCFLMGKYPEAVIWYEKMAQIFGDMKPGKQKEKLRKPVENNRALYHFCMGEYDRALQALGQATVESLSDRIENAMMYARVYLAVGETKRAIKPLTFVAEHGNKLYFATEAKILLEKIDMEE